ncbi:hypothetical protein AVEN_175529-1 [Araneus ventricosus]|uniref:Uncharacterized protein n=1 Tax=Araneus ventricosus TaxID=182803 RepID=A0A4Y2CMM8_ARAVE|nr:hypothetical protein AVEN_175529-1 [Araneus ventricosus]
MAWRRNMNRREGYGFYPLAFLLTSIIQKSITGVRFSNKLLSAISLIDGGFLGFPPRGFPSASSPGRQPSPIYRILVRLLPHVIPRFLQATEDATLYNQKYPDTFQNYTNSLHRLYVFQETDIKRRTFEI